MASVGYVADKIKRFREAPPTSRAEREANRDNMEQPWWIDDVNAAKNPSRYGGENKRYQIPSSGGGSKDERNLGFTGTGELNLSASLDDFDSNPRRSRPPQANKQTLSAGDNPFTQLTSIDDMIAQEIQNLEREINNDPRRSIGGIEIDIRSSYDNTAVVPMGLKGGLRDSKEFMRKSSGGGGGTRGDPLADLRLSGDYYKSSIDTLGSTGFKALLYPEMKLDGKDINVNSNIVGGDINYDVNVLEGGTVVDIHASMQELLKAIAKEGDEGGGTSGNRNAVNSISEITANLNSEMSCILNHLSEKQIREEAEEKERKARDEKMKEEGRLEERSKQFLEFEELENQNAAAPFSFRNFHFSDPAAAAYAVGLPPDGKGPVPPPIRTSASVGEGRIPTNFNPSNTPMAAAGDLLAEHPNRRLLTPFSTVLSAVDSEVQSAEELFSHMKTLKSQLQKRMQYIDELAEGGLQDGRTVNGQAVPVAAIGLKQPFVQQPYPPSNYYYARSIQDARSPWASYQQQPLQGAVSHQLNNTKDGDAYGPHIEIKHTTLAEVSSSIGSDLDVAMKALNFRLRTSDEASRAVYHQIWTATGNVIEKITGNSNSVSNDTNNKNTDVYNTPSLTRTTADVKDHNVGFGDNEPHTHITRTDEKGQAFVTKISPLPEKKNAETDKLSEVQKTEIKAHVTTADEVTLPKKSLTDPNSVEKEANENLFDKVLGRESADVDKSDFGKFVPPTLAEAMVHRDRAIRDTSVPVYGGAMAGPLGSQSHLYQINPFWNQVPHSVNQTEAAAPPHPTVAHLVAASHPTAVAPHPAAAPQPTTTAASHPATVPHPSVPATVPHPTAASHPSVLATVPHPAAVVAPHPTAILHPSAASPHYPVSAQSYLIANSAPTSLAAPFQSSYPSSTMQSTSPSAPPQMFTGHAPHYENLNRYKATFQEKYNMPQFGVRDNFPYPTYQRPEEGQTLDFIRNQYNAYPSVSTHENTQPVPYMTATSPKPASSPNASFEERQNFLKGMQKYRSNLAQGASGSSIASY